MQELREIGPDKTVLINLAFRTARMGRDPSTLK